MWTDLYRRTAERKGLRYPSDLSEAEWRLVEPLIPPAKRGGRKRSINVPEVLDGICYPAWKMDAG
jgi:transposase